MDKEALKAHFKDLAASHERDYQYKIARQNDITARLYALEEQFDFDLDAYSDIYGILGLNQHMMVADGIIGKWARLFNAMQYPNTTLVAFADRKNPNYYDGSRYEKTFIPFGVIAHGELQVNSRVTVDAETGEPCKEFVLTGGQIFAFDGLDITEVQEYVLASSKTKHGGERPDVFSTAGKVICEGGEGVPSEEFLAILHSQGIRANRALSVIYHLQHGMGYAGIVGANQASD